MADDDDAIYIDVIPKVDDAAADSAVGKLKDKFKDVAKDVGPEFMDALGNSGALEQLGTKLGEALSGPLKDLSEGVGLDLKNPLEKMLRQDMGGALNDVASQLGSKLSDAIGIDLSGAVSKALDKDWGGVGASLGKAVGGKLGDALGINELLGPDGLDGVIDKVHGVRDAYLNAHNAVTSTASGLTDAAAGMGLGGFAGSKGSSLLGSVGEFAEPLAVAGGVSAAAGAGNSWIQKVQAAHPALAPWLTPVADVTSAIAAPVDEAKGWFNWLTQGDKPAQPNSSDNLYAGTFGGGGGGGGSSSTTANEVEVQSSVATISAGTVTLGGNISLPASMTSPSASSGGGRGGNSPLLGKGGSAAAGGGGEASLYSGGGDSLFIDRTPHDQGSSQTGVLGGSSPGHDNTLFSGEGGEYVVNPQATQQNKGLLDQINSGGPNFNDPNSGGPKQQDQMGYGSGFGLTGTGLIGLGESLPGMLGTAAASGAGGMGAGSGAGAAAALAQSLWQNIGQPELNEAIKKGGQIASAAALAPIETTWLGGGQMGAPSVGSPAKAGWTGKLLGGLLGSQFSAPNIAGAVQPPKDPSQQDQDSDQDPGAASGQPGGKQQGGKGEHAGPTGHKDDPIHVQPVGGSSPPMNTNQSNATIPAVGSAVPGL